MKKVLLSEILLVAFNLVMSSEHDALLRIIPDKAIKPCIVGFKNFTAQDLLALEEKHREVLERTTNPSYIERSFGMDNHTVSLERLAEITNLPNKVKDGMRLEVLPIKDSYCINGHRTPDGCCSPRSSCNPTEMGGILGGMVSACFVSSAFVMSSTNPLFWLLLIPALKAPFCGMASGEVATCVWYRCCAERKQMIIQNNK